MKKEIFFTPFIFIFIFILSACGRFPENLDIVDPSDDGYSTPIDEQTPEQNGEEIVFVPKRPVKVYRGGGN